MKMKFTVLLGVIVVAVTACAQQGGQQMTQEEIDKENQLNAQDMFEDMREDAHINSM
jgi:hypothetical protein